MNPLAALAGAPPVRSLVNRGFHAYARSRTRELASLDPVEVQRRTLLDLVGRARNTRFGFEHDFRTIRSVADFRARVPIRTYEALWEAYLKGSYPRFEGLTWPGRIPYLALTSGTTQGATKYIPVSEAMIASNRKAAKTMVAYHMASRPDSKLFRGKLFMLGGSTDLESPGRGIRQGDLSGIAAQEAGEWLRPYAFPPLALALEADWDRKLALLAERSIAEPITLVGGVPSWLLALFGRVLDLSGKSTLAEVWPGLEVVVHGGVKFDPYRAAFEAILGDPKIRLQETYPCSEGFIAFGDPATGLLRLMFDHGLFYEFVPVAELDEPTPSRRWLGDVEVGVDYAIVVSTCAGLWAHLIGDTIRFGSLDPPLLRFTGRTKYMLSAFGEHLSGEELEGAIAGAADETGASVREWHVGPSFHGAMGHHVFVVEFTREPDDLTRFRDALDAELARRNADYQAHRIEGIGLPRPAVVVARPGGFEAWMRSRGKLGGQHKVPRVDASGSLTAEVVATLRGCGMVARELAEGHSPGPGGEEPGPG